MVVRRNSQGCELFQHLMVKAFLAIRPHADQLVSTVQLMLGTGLPSFKGEPTIKRLKDRFALGAHENVRSTATMSPDGYKMAYRTS
ncbi:hypothetical protein BD769DRAFT_1460196, partial [Suillus cothurnatus]